MQPPHYQKLSILAHFRTSGQTCENTAFSVLKKPRRLRVGWGPSAQVRLPVPQGSHHSIAAGEAAGADEAADPTGVALLCGGG